MRKDFKTPELLSTHEVAQLLGVDMTTVINWCSKGKLSSFKTPGGHRRIRVDDLLQFIQKFEMPVPEALQQSADFRCVVVDDDPSIVKIVIRVLEAASPGIRIESAGDGFTAGQRISELRPNLVVLDINLPGINGLAVCKRIRADKRLAGTRILAITGEAVPEIKDQAFEAGADGFLAKPFTPDDLRTAVLKFLPRP